MLVGEAIGHACQSYQCQYGVGFPLKHLHLLLSCMPIRALLNLLPIPVLSPSAPATPF